MYVTAAQTRPYHNLAPKEQKLNFDNAAAVQANLPTQNPLLSAFDPKLTYESYRHLHSSYLFCATDPIMARGLVMTCYVKQLVSRRNGSTLSNYHGFIAYSITVMDP